MILAAKDLAKTLTESGSPARAKALGRVPAALKRHASLIDDGLSEEQEDALIGRLPRFFYFSEYELLKGGCDLHDLAARQESGDLGDGDETMLSLLKLAGEGPKDFLEEEYDSRKAELQAASMDLSRQVFEYWKQNDALTVVFDTDMPVVGIVPPDRPGGSSSCPEDRTEGRSPRCGDELLNTVCWFPVVLLLPGRLQRIPGQA